MGYIKRAKKYLVIKEHHCSEKRPLEISVLEDTEWAAYEAMCDVEYSEQCCTEIYVKVTKELLEKLEKENPDLYNQIAEDYV